MNKFPIVDLGPELAEGEELLAFMRSCALFLVGVVFGALAVVVGLSLALKLF